MDLSLFQVKPQGNRGAAQANGPLIEPQTDKKQTEPQHKPKVEALTVPAAE